MTNESRSAWSADGHSFYRRRPRLREGVLAAGPRFAAGYPITPSTEVGERFAARLPTVGGCFIQMEDELAASIALLAVCGVEQRPSP